MEAAAVRFSGSIGFAASVDLAIILLLVHIVCRRKWPPFKAASPQLVVYTGIAVSPARCCSALVVTARACVWGARTFAHMRAPLSM